MTNRLFIRMRSKSTRRRWADSDRKAVEYTRGNDDDRLCNFKRIAELFEVPVAKVIGIYMTKHFDAFVEWTKTGRRGTEGIVGRLDDLRNYCDLCEQWVNEKETDS